MQNSYKIINLEYLKAMSGDTDFMHSILTVFLEQAEKLETDMHRALKNNDYDLLATAAHRAKSSVSIIGMASEAEEMAKLEQDIRKKQKTETYKSRVNSFLRNIEKAVAETEAALAEL